MSDWFYVTNGNQQGPVPQATLQQLAASGQLKPSDSVWTAGMPAWQPAVSIAGIFPAGTMPPPMPAQPIGYASPGAPYATGPSLGDDAATRWLLPVGRSGWAIAAGYLGLISVVLFPAPLALICSIIAIRDIKTHPNRHGMGRAIFGLVTGIIFSIGLVFLIGSMLTKR
jgi:hypothetical protein